MPDTDTATRAATGFTWFVPTETAPQEARPAAPDDPAAQVVDAD